ncbi:ATP-binding protein [Nocardia sp. NPDC024068]|uniref:ATP-binding protein n=1 Tax=Nocardia sp. NPDC024068 TaxID=3157197 RepID=UPI0033F09CF9
MSQFKWSDQHQAFLITGGVAVGELDERFRDEISVSFADIEEVKLDVLAAALGEAARWRDKKLKEKHPDRTSGKSFAVSFGEFGSQNEPWFLFEIDESDAALRFVMGLRSLEFSWVEENVLALIDRIWKSITCRIERLSHTWNDGVSPRELPLGWEVELALEVVSERSVGDLVQLARLTQSILRLPWTQSAQRASIDLEMTRGLLRAGQFEWLVGEEESSWLEVKSAPYDLSKWAGKIELAQDVARFANAEVDGILIIGFRTKRSISTETISKLSPIELESDAAERYRKIIDSRVYPLVDGLKLEQFIVTEGRSILAISIPAQCEDLKPFLVQGAIVDGAYEGAFISIVRRRGEGSVPVTAPAIHAYLAAGRRILNAPGQTG